MKKRRIRYSELAAPPVPSDVATPVTPVAEGPVVPEVPPGKVPPARPRVSTLRVRSRRRAEKRNRMRLSKSWRANRTSECATEFARDPG